MAKIAQQRAELDQARAENARLKAQLVELGVAPDNGAGDEAVAAESPDATAGGTDERPAKTSRRRAG